MQPEAHSGTEMPPAAGGGHDFAAGADSSNRPWETDSLRLEADRPPLALGWLAMGAAAALLLSALAPGEGATGSPGWRLWLGILLLPAYAAGYRLTGWGLADVGGWRARPLGPLGFYVAVLAVVLHALLGSPVPATAASRPLVALLALLLAAFSLCLALAVATGQSRYPPWLALANPFLLTALCTLPFSTTPWLDTIPPGFHLAHLLFFLAVTVTLSRFTADTKSS